MCVVGGCVGRDRQRDRKRQRTELKKRTKSDVKSFQIIVNLPLPTYLNLELSESWFKKYFI